MTMDGFRIGRFAVVPHRNAVFTPAGDEIRLQPKVMDVLCTLARRPGDVVTRERLIDEIWRGQYGAEHGPTRAIAKLRRVFGDANGSPEYIETIPKRGYRLIAPVSLDGADPSPGDGSLAPGAAHNGPEFADREPPTAGIAQDRPGNGRDRDGIWRRLPPGMDRALKRTEIFRSVPRPVIAIGAPAILAILVILVFVPLMRNSPQLAQNRIEVKEFRIIGRQGGDTRLATFAESLFTNLSAVLAANNIEIVSGPAGDGRRAANIQLGADIERDRDHVLVSVKFYDTPSGTQIWSHIHKRTAEELSGLRDQISAHTTRVLGCALELRGETGNIAAENFQSLLQICSGGGNLLTHSERLVNSDPDNPRALAVHAIILATRPDAYLRPTAVQERNARLARAHAIATRALEIDPDEPLARTALVLSDRHPQTRAEVEARMRQIMSGAWIDGSGGTAGRILRLDYGGLLREVGRLRDAAYIYRNSVSVDPFDDYAHIRFAWITAARDSLSMAEAIFDEVERRNPDYYETYQRRFEIDLFYRDPDDALALLDGSVGERIRYSREKRNCFEVFARARKNVTPENSAAVAEACSVLQPDWRVRMFSILGDLDRAYAAAEDMKPLILGQARVLYYRGMRNFRRDPRFWPFAARFGLVDYWLDTDNWPDFCLEKDLPFDCREKALAVRKAAG